MVLGWWRLTAKTNCPSREALESWKTAAGTVDLIELLPVAIVRVERPSSSVESASDSEMDGIVDEGIEREGIADATGF